MYFTRKALFVSLVLAMAAAATVGCSTQGSDNAGAGASGGGVEGGAGGNAGQGKGGAAVGGRGGAAGAVGGGDAGGSGGAAGQGLGGQGGIGGVGGAASSSTKPSGGCNKAAARPAGGVITLAGQHYVTFPPNYDGKTPLPLFMGFHGCGAVNRGTTKDNTEWISLSKGTGFESGYVRFVPISSDTAGCWNYGADVAKVLKAFDDLIANHCIDLNRVFATGHSSGAQLITQILSTPHAADAQHFSWKAVAPIAASDNGALSGATAVMYIQGKMDKERASGDGHESVARFKTANMCTDAALAYAPVVGCRSQDGGGPVEPGCVKYEGCKAATIWCSHNDPFYSGTMHGVPCFAMKAMFDFFETFR